MSMFYLGIVPARGGSKRIPRKNLSLLGGRPLLDYTAEASRQSRRLGNTVISTDSPEIAQFANTRGLMDFGLRPAALAQDHSPPGEAIADALGKFASTGVTVDAIVLLQPTSPFRSARHIDEAIGRFEASGADTLVSVIRAHDHPYWVWRETEECLQPYFSMREIAVGRQDLPPAVVENGAIYIVRSSLAVSGKIYGEKIVPYLMDDFSSIDIDTPEDLLWAEFQLERHGP